MSFGRRLLAWALAFGVIGAILAAVIILHPWKEATISLRGVVIRQDPDARKQLPVAEVEIEAMAGPVTGKAKSDSSGYWSLTLPKSGGGPAQPTTLLFHHPDYKPLELHEPDWDRNVVARLQPVHQDAQPNSDRPEVLIANVVVRYSTKSVTDVNVGSAVKSFEVANSGNVPCNGQGPCSPDGKWKAAVVKATLHAEEGNEFRNVRVSCIAGPCPFTKVENDTIFRGGRDIEVAVRNWSDTATYLLEAEVIHPMVSDAVRVSYPVIFGEALNFALPAAAEGVSIQAEINNETIVFPLGPKLLLSWADCKGGINPDQTKVYRCELKPGYRFL